MARKVDHPYNRRSYSGPASGGPYRAVSLDGMAYEQSDTPPVLAPGAKNSSAMLLGSRNDDAE